MLRKTLVIMLAALVLSTPLGFRPTQAQTALSAQLTDEIRSGIAKLGAGRAARVEVKLHDQTKLKGYISKVEADSFTFTNSKTGASQTIAYADVAQVKKPSRGLSARTWVIIGAAAAAAVIVGVTVIKPVLCDGGAGC